MMIDPSENVLCEQSLNRAFGLEPVIGDGGNRASAPSPAMKRGARAALANARLSRLGTALTTMTLDRVTCPLNSARKVGNSVNEH
jgi:hypothetical protein